MKHKVLFIITGMVLLVVLVCGLYPITQEGLTFVTNVKNVYDSSNMTEYKTEMVLRNKYKKYWDENPMFIWEVTRDSGGPYVVIKYNSIEKGTIDKRGVFKCDYNKSDEPQNIYVDFKEKDVVNMYYEVEYVGGDEPLYHSYIEDVKAEYYDVVTTIYDKEIKKIYKRCNITIVISLLGLCGWIFYLVKSKIKKVSAKCS